MTELYYGVSVPDSQDLDFSNIELKPFYTDKSEVMKVLKEIKTGRFKVFKTKDEAEEFSKLSSDPVPPPSSELLSSPKPSEKCEFKSLKPQEEVKFRKSIESNPSDLVFLQSCIEENARYLVTPSDTPTILQQGQRHNALHVAARHGKLEAARLVLSHVTGDLMMRMYPEECQEQNKRRREHLVDMYLNMPDKGGGDTPLHLAAKFGHLELVRLLCSYHQTKLEQSNKFGEVASQVVCTRAREQVAKEEIQEILEGQLVIPVYRNNDAKQLGKPISLREASDLLESSLSDVSQCSGGTPLSPMVTRDSSPMVSRGTSPLVQSTRGSSPLVQSTRARVSNHDVSSGQLSPLVTSLSAVMGPLPSSQAKNIYRKWRTGGSEARDNMTMRLADPVLGVERQGRDIANKEGVSWLEFWPWLGEYLDIASDEGLQTLENYLETKTQQTRDRLEREYQDDIDDEFEASLAADQNHDNNDDNDDNDEVFSGELELVTHMTSSTPARTGDNWTSYRSADHSLDNSDLVLNTDKNGNNTKSEPLSPLSCLMSGINSINLTSDHGTDNVSNMSTLLSNITTPPSRVKHSLSSEVMRVMEQFVTTCVSLITDNVTHSDTDPLEQDWLTPLLSHWSVLRRRVNNWRSDPLERWSGLEWSRLGVRLVEMICDQVRLELGAGLEKERVGLMLARLADTDDNQDNNDDDDNVDNYGRGRRRKVSGAQVTGVKDISRLCSLVSKSLLNDQYLVTAGQCEALWNLETVKTCVSTNNVNRARRFLHKSSTSSVGSVGSVTSSVSSVNTRAEMISNLDTDHRSKNVDQSISVDIRPSKDELIPDNDDHIPGNDEQSRVRRDSVESEESEDTWVTPPCSPGASSVASMETCSEGVQVRHDHDQYY